MVCFPTSTAEVQACVPVARRHGRPFVARGSGTGLAGGAVPLDDAVVIVTTKMNRVLSVDLDARVGVGRAGRAQPRPVAGSVAQLRAALRARPVQPADAARSAATSPPTPAARTASPTASPARTSSPSRWCCPTASVDRARRRRPRAAPGSTCAARSSAARACSASPPRSCVRLTPEPARGAHDAARLRRRSTTARRR